MSSKLCFACVAGKRGAIARSRRAKQSFGDKCVPKQELAERGAPESKVQHPSISRPSSPVRTWKLSPSFHRSAFQVQPSMRCHGLPAGAFFAFGVAGGSSAGGSSASAGASSRVAVAGGGSAVGGAGRGGLANQSTAAATIAKARTRSRTRRIAGVERNGGAVARAAGAALKPARCCLFRDRLAHACEAITRGASSHHRRTSPRLPVRVEHDGGRLTLDRAEAFALLAPF